MDFELICPECRKAMTVETGWSGKAVICPSCGKGVFVPDVVTEAAPPPPPPVTPPQKEQLAGEKEMTHAEELLLMSKLAEIRAEYEADEEYPAWRKGWRRLLAASIPCIIFTVVLAFIVRNRDVFQIAAGICLLILFIVWVMATFRKSG